MAKFRKISSVLAVVVVVVGIGLAVGWWASSRSGSGGGQASNCNDVAAATPAAANQATVTRPAHTANPKRVTEASNPVVSMPKPTAVPTNAPGLPGWEEKVDAI